MSVVAVVSDCASLAGVVGVGILLNICWVSRDGSKSLRVGVIEEGIEIGDGVTDRVGVVSPARDRKVAGSSPTS